ncbi:phage tail tube protein [Dactylosporangium sp. CS-033363]|uniref:phage tail tube protein n=1 Tax=Dactylosporangium sp. CS-033363 TaxID=3239935 RepID=UPI003D93FC4C
MSQTTVPAREMIFQVQAGDAVTWLSLTGMNNFNLSPGENEEVEDTTTFDSDGAYEEVVMQRGASVACQGFKMEDDTTGVQDVGQARIEELASKTGGASRGKVRFRHIRHSQWKVWTATFRLGDQGGGNNNNNTWSCTVRRVGKTQLVAAP